jgi:exonuclease I
MYDLQTPTNEVIVCPVYVNMHELANLAANKTTDRAGATAVENKVREKLQPLTLITINQSP